MFAAAGWQVVTIKWGRLISEPLRARRRRGATRAGWRPCRTRSTSGCCGCARPRSPTGSSRPAEATNSEPCCPRSTHRAGRGDPRSRRSRPRPAGRHLPRHRLPSPHDRFRVHGQGAGAADGGTSQQPLRAADLAQMQTLADTCAMDTARPVAALRPRHTAGQLCDRRARQLHRHPVTAVQPVAIPASLGHPHRKSVSTQAALGTLPRRPRTRRPGSGCARGHLQPRRRVLDQPRRLDQQDGSLVGTGPA